MIKKIFNFIFGFTILFTIYIVSLFIIKLTNIQIPPAILGIILFTFFLSTGIIKETWIKNFVDFMLKNMAILFIPFIGGLITYKNLILKNWFAIIMVILIATTLTIVLTGLFVEYGVKYLRYYKIRRRHD